MRIISGYNLVSGRSRIWKASKCFPTSYTKNKKNSIVSLNVQFIDILYRGTDFSRKTVRNLSSETEN